MPLIGDKLQKDVRQWLSPPDPWKNYNLGRESRHSGTGTWWTQSDSYAEWKCSGPSSLLWVNGKRQFFVCVFFPEADRYCLFSGCRKERHLVRLYHIVIVRTRELMLFGSSSIIEDITALQKSGLASLAFFYFDFREDQKKDLRGLLSSLLVQLCEQSDAYSAILSEFYVAHRSGLQHASDSELLACLKDALKLQGQATVYIIIDALDECPITTGLLSHREKVLDLVEELVDIQIPNLRICITSRPEADIVPALEPLAFRSVSLHSESGQVQDITEYIRFFVHTKRELRRWKETDKQLVIDVLTKKADGM